MGGQPGPGVWWLVDLEQDQKAGHDLVCAPNRRKALAIYRANMVTFYSAHETRRWAAGRVRTLGLVIVDGPLTPQQALDHALGWAWARQITRREEATSRTEPAGPASREEAERLLGPELVGRIEREVAGAYLGSLPPGKVAVIANPEKPGERVSNVLEQYI